MSRLQKLRRIAIHLLKILVALVLLFSPYKEEAILLIAIVMAFALLVWGMRMLVFYLRMARHMVGGFSLLFVGVIALDASLLALTLLDNSPVFVMLYLVAERMFAGAVAFARAFEARGYKSPWKLKLLHGIIEIAAAIACVVFLRMPSVLVDVYSVSLIYSALISIIDTLRPQDIVYIQ